MNHCEALRQGYQRLNQIDSVHWCPLGSGAIAGNALGIDRDALASDLGFKNGPSLNAANSTGNRDAVLGKEYIDEFFWAEYLVDPYRGLVDVEISIKIIFRTSVSLL